MSYTCNYDFSSADDKYLFYNIYISFWWKEGQNTESGSLIYLVHMYLLGILIQEWQNSAYINRQTQIETLHGLDGAVCIVTIQWQVLITRPGSMENQWSWKH
jgi:hypothetical protein